MRRRIAGEIDSFIISLHTKLEQHVEHTFHQRSEQLSCTKAKQQEQDFHVTSSPTLHLTFSSQNFKPIEECAA